MICDPCKRKDHDNCLKCPCQHRATTTVDGKQQPVDGDKQSRLPG